MEIYADTRDERDRAITNIRFDERRRISKAKIFFFNAVSNFGKSRHGNKFYYKKEGFISLCLPLNNCLIIVLFIDRRNMDRLKKDKSYSRFFEKTVDESSSKIFSSKIRGDKSLNENGFRGSVKWDRNIFATFFSPCLHCISSREGY